MSLARGASNASGQFWWFSMHFRVLHRSVWYVSKPAIFAGPRGHLRRLHMPSPA